MRLEDELVYGYERAAGHGQVTGALAAGDSRGVLVDGYLTEHRGGVMVYRNGVRCSGVQGHTGRSVRDPRRSWRLSTRVYDNLRYDLLWLFLPQALQTGCMRSAYTLR